MDIHKPKPWHGRREFLKEVATIVLGVLIAIAAEQLVEQLHWVHAVHDEREALSSELKGNLEAVVFRRAQEVCIDRRLNELGGMFSLQAQGRPTEIKGHIGRPVLWLWTQNAWQIALSDQSLAHMPLHDRLAMSEAFDDYRSFEALREQEDAAWRRLSLLDRPEALTPADWPLLRQAYADALGLSDRLKLKMVYMVDNYRFGEKLSLPSLPPAQAEAERRFCSSTGQH